MQKNGNLCNLHIFPLPEQRGAIKNYQKNRERQPNITKRIKGLTKNYQKNKEGRPKITKRIKWQQKITKE